VSITTPQMGEAFNVKYPQRGSAWWFGMDSERDQVTAQNA
jgi:hypothetical protein